MDYTKKRDMQRFHCIALTRHSFCAPPPGNVETALLFSIHSFHVVFLGGGLFCLFVSSLSKKSKIIAMIKNTEG